MSRFKLRIDFQVLHLSKTCVSALQMLLIDISKDLHELEAFSMRIANGVTDAGKICELVRILFSRNKHLRLIDIWLK